MFARQRERAEAIQQFFTVRREWAEKARDKARKTAEAVRIERRQARQARGYDLTGPTRSIEYVYEHVDRPMRPYVNLDKDRRLRGKARVKARRAARIEVGP